MKKQLRSRFLAMMIPLTLLFVFVAQSAYGANPTKKLLTLSFNKTPLATALKAVEKESGCKVLFTYDEVQPYHVTASVKKEPLTHAMTAILKGLPFQYKLNGNFVIVSKNAQAAVQPAQKAAGNKVFGVIVDEEGEPLIGVTVRIKGTGKGTITNFDGEFSLEDDNRKTPLLFSYIGKEDIEKLPVYGKSMKLVMKDSQVGKKLDEVIVVGYGTMKKRDVTGSISSISSKEIENKMATNVYEALQGSTAGVQVVSGSGQPGESSTIKVRGTSTFSSEGVSPLYIVDGAPMESIDDINPSDIVSVEVLKDAASAAIYGSRSANGVIIVTTRGGQEGKPEINVKYYHSWGKLSHKIPQANRADRLFYDQARRNYFLTYGGGNPDQSMDILQDPYNYFFNVDNDYLDMITQVGNKDEVDVSIGGGSKALKYFVNTAYYNERGIIDNTGYQRFSTRVNADYSPSKWLSMGSRMSLSYSKKEGVNEGQLLSSVLSRRPYFNTTYSDGSIVGVFNGQKNPVALINNTTDFTNSYKANFYQYFNFKFNKHLSFRTNINANFYLDKRKKLIPSLITDEWQKSNNGYSYNYLNWNWMNENYFTYTRNWGAHHFTGMAGMSVQKWYYENENIAGMNASTDYIYTLNAFAANLDLSATGSVETRHSLASFYTRITYDYLRRYLLTLNVRRDGSSRFAKNNKWGNFPSASFGWRFSDEKFMKGARKVMTDGKIRVSYGVTGNQSIGNYEYVYSYTPSNIYDGVGGVKPARIGSSDLKWEETRQFDLGLDLNFFNNRLVVTADYYYKYTDGLLANYQLPKETGFSYIRKNIGEISNRGFELSISGDIIRKKNLTWNASFNISGNSNTVEKLAEGKAYMEGDIWWMQEGGHIGDFYGFKCLGVFPYDESNAFTSDWKQLTPVFENGVFQYKYLLNGQEYTGEVHKKRLPNGQAFRGGDYNWAEPAGTENGIIDDNDRMVIGNAMPDVTGGFNTSVKWKNFNLYLGFYYSIGGKIYNAAENNRNMFKYDGTTPSPYTIYNMWLKPGDNALYPRPFNDEYNNGRMGNSFYLEDASFVRLSNVRLSYDLPQALSKKLFMKRLNVYFFANNVLTWTNYSGFDPEFSTSNPLQIGKDSYRYPRKREFGVGFNANF